MRLGRYNIEKKKLTNTVGFTFYRPLKYSTNIGTYGGLRYLG